MQDETYIERGVRFEDLTSYKRIVARESGLGNVGDFTRDTFRMIVKQNLHKLYYLCLDERKLSDAVKIDDLLTYVAEKQNTFITQAQYCYVLNTGLLFLPQFGLKWDE